MGPMGPKTCTPHPDTTIAALAARQHGVAAGRQLAALGITPKMLRTRIARGSLLRLHRGVYAVGHEQLRKEGRWLAAVLAVGPGAALSHRDAAGLHGIRPANHQRIDVTTSKRGRGSHLRIEVHYAVLGPLDVIKINGIPVTSLARTLVDLAGAVPRDHLMKALNRAELNRALDVKAIETALEHLRGRSGPGHAAIRSALAELADHGPALTRSELEDRFLALLAAHHLTRPKTNFHVEGHEFDAVWPERRLAVELDGYVHHRDRPTFQRDREKGNALTRAGWKLLRYTYDDVVRHPARTVAELAEQLA
jgi:predicted transcriptional regulator of viral defense system/very-short-patch-repair endonuclease